MSIAKPESVGVVEYWVNTQTNLFTQSDALRTFACGYHERYCVNVITPRQARFVFEYCKDFNATKAYVRAGYAEQGAGAGGSRLLENVEVQEAIEERKAMLAEVATLSPEWVLHQWMQIASANPNDLVKIEQISCSGCYDDDTRALLTTTGLGDSLKAPNPKCSKCRGHGEKFVSVADTSKLRGAARRLYAGAVQTKDGIKVLMRDQDAALANLRDYLGMVVKRSELSGPGGGPVPLASMTASDFTEEQLMAIVAAGTSQSALSDGNSGVSLGVSEGMPQPTVIDAIA